MNMKTLLTGILLTVSLFSFSQTKLIYMASGDAIEKGAKAHDKENYKSALKYYNKVQEGDTNYHTSQYEIAMTYFAMKEYQKSIDICEVETEIENYSTTEFYNLMGNAYDELEDRENAVKAYTKGISIYPTYYRLYYNRAITYERMEKWQECADDLMMSVRLNPYHYNSHYKLGELAKEEGQYTKAMLCYNSFLLIKASGNLEFLSEYEDYLIDEYDSEPRGVNLSTDDYSDIDDMIISKAAMDKKYKTPNKLNLPIVKQNFLLFQELQKRDLGEGFWDAFYVPFFNQIMADEKFNDYMYYSLQSTTNQSIVNVLNKNIKKIKAFPDYAGDLWQEKHSDNYQMYEGEMQKVHYYWRNTSSLTGMGKVVDGEPVGKFNYYYAAGRLSAIGNYDQDGERMGKWQYFHINGLSSGVEYYQDGEMTGEDSSYYENGVLKAVTNYESGKSNGKSTHFYNTGVMSNYITNKDGDLNGPALYYYEAGMLHYKLEYTNDDISGKFISYHDNGVVSEDVGFLDGKRTGLGMEYYPNGQKKGQYNYLNGDLEGVLTQWYKDGTLQAEGEYKEDVAINIRKEYNPNGTLESEAIYDENGKKNGEYKEYDKNGNLNMVLTYKKGDLVAYQIFHRDGTLLKEAKKKGGEFLFENYYSDGTQRTVGVYLADGVGKNGVWKFYDHNGVLDSESTYSNGQINGKAKSFYSSGRKYSTTSYTDGDANGLYVKYYDHGQVAEQGYYLNDEQEGLWVRYEADGTISDELFYSLGKRNGPQKYYDVAGKLDIVDFYEDGVSVGFEVFDTTEASVQKIDFTGDSALFTVKYFTGETLRTFTKKGKIQHGPSTYFYTDGKKIREGNYWNGQKNGKWTNYFKNGQVNKVGEYFHGNKTGDWVYYHENGKKLLTETYKDGNIHGLRTWFHDNGEKDTERTYENGVVHGLAYYYDGNGVLQHIRSYFFGKIVGYAYTGTDGKPVEIIPIVNETCECKSYFSNGKIARQFSLTNGNFNGEYLEYFENGKPFMKSVYQNDISEGVKTTYWSNGKVKLEEIYVHGNKEGLVKHYNSTGALIKTEMYLLDVKHGPTQLYKAGKVVKTLNYYDSVLLIK